MAQVEISLLLSLALVVGGLWFFANLAEEVVEGDTHAVDEMLLLAMREPDDRSDPLGPQWFEGMMRDFTALGSTGVLILLVGGVAGFLLLRGHSQPAALILVTVIGGFLLSNLLKLGFDRPRPDLVSRATYVYNASFPSGHSLISAATYLTLGAMLARLQPRRWLKFYLLGLATLLTFVVGVSRVYLGVHWPTDVLGGWTVGAVWASVTWLVMWWQQRGSRRGSEA